MASSSNTPSLNDSLNQFIDLTDNTILHSNNLLSDQYELQGISSSTCSYPISTSTIHDDLPIYTSHIPHVLQQFADESHAIHQLHELRMESHQHIQFLYTYRSISKALPLSAQDTDDDMKHEIHKNTFTILRDSIMKLQALKVYVDKSVKSIALLSYLPIRTELNKNTVCLPLLDSFAELFDSVVVIDMLKDIKASIRNDFSTYRRSLQIIRRDLSGSESMEYENQMEQLRLFLNNPQQPQAYIMWLLKNELQKLNDSTVLIALILNRITDRIDTHQCTTPHTHHYLYRLLPSMLYLLDRDHTFNVFRGHSKLKPQVNMDRIAKMIRNMPVVPLYADMQLSMIEVLKRCTNFTPEVEQTFVTKQPTKVYAVYDLHGSRDTMRQQYRTMTIEVQACIQESKALLSGINNLIPKESNQKQLMQQHGSSVYTTILRAVNLLSEWHIKYDLYLSYKYSHPIDDSLYTQRSAGNVAKTAEQGRDYEKALRYNLTVDEQSSLLECIVNIKSLSEMINKNLASLMPFIHIHIYTTIQSFLQSDSVLRPLKKLLSKTSKPNKTKENDKTKEKDTTQTLIQQVRFIAGDWQNRSIDSLSVNDNDILLSTAALSLSQMQLLARLLHNTYSERASGQQSSFFGDKDLTKQEVTEYTNLHQQLQYNYPSMVQLYDTILELSFTPTIWYREFYLEISKAIQFPIQLSMPWILIENLTVNNKSTNLHIPHLWYCFELYNDAAYYALRELKSAYLFDEIEAECNLSFDQMFFYLGEQLFQHYKTAASYTLIDKLYEQEYSKKNAELEQLMGKMGVSGSGSTLLSSSSRRSKKKRINVGNTHFDVFKYQSLLTQHSVSMLGRVIPFTQLLIDKMNLMIKQNISHIIRKFESQQLSSIIELEWQLDNIKRTHSLLVEHGLLLDSYHQLFAEANQDTNLGVAKGRIVLHIIQELCDDVITHFIYNNVTQRFIRSMHHAGKQPDRLRVSTSVQQWQYYGSNGYDKLYDKLAATYRNYIGSEHMAAMLRICSESDILLIVNELRHLLTGKLVNEFGAYSAQLIDSMTGIKLPKIAFGVTAAHMAIQLKVQHIANYEALRGVKQNDTGERDTTIGVFPYLTQLGNGLILIGMLDKHLQLRRNIQASIVAPYLSMSASTYTGKDNQRVPVKLFQRTTAAAAASSTYTSSPINEHIKEHYDPVFSKNYGSLFAGILKHLHDVIQQYLSLSWSIQSNASGNVIDVEQPRTISRLLSVLQFIFLQPPDGSRGNGKSQTDSSVYGDGYNVASMTLIYLTGQLPLFNQLDFSYHILKLHTIQPLIPTYLAADDGRRTSRKAIQQPTEQEKQELITIDFIENVKSIKQRNNELIALLQSYYTVDQGIGVDLVIPSYQEYLIQQQQIASRTPIINQGITIKTPAASEEKTSPAVSLRPSLSVGDTIGISINSVSTTPTVQQKFNHDQFGLNALE